MGLSSSQGRLLSITSRLTDNEYQSQQITNAKMRLAATQHEALIEYQNALKSNMLVYSGFDAQGNPFEQNLTPSILFQYQPLKNQYALINTSNRILVSNIDAKNYENTDNMIDFLDQYGLLSNYKGEYSAYQEQYRQYLEDYALYKADLSQWEIDEAAYEEYLAAYAEWEETQISNELYQNFSTKIGTSDSPIAYCYKEGLNGSASCYLHLLNMMLDYDGSDKLQGHTYTASCDKNGDYTTDRTVTTNAQRGAMFSTEYYATMKGVSDCLNETNSNGNPRRLCDGDDKFNGKDGATGNLIQAAIDEGRRPTAIEILRSDYIYDPKTNSVAGVKSLKQKTIDLYYMLQNNMIQGETLRETLINFTEGDMRGLTTPEPELVPNPGVAPEPPVEPTPPEVHVDDKEKAQWYINLWCRMNGNEEAPRIQTKEGLDELDEYFKKYIIENAKTNKRSDNLDKCYEALDPKLASSTTWLQDVLTQGIVIMQRVDTEEIDGAYKYHWNEMIHSNASEFISVTDENAIAIAEAKYEQAMKDIEAKDKRYQMKINKLDTEHNALQTEYESVQSAMNKNIERSFKAFS